MTDLTVELVGEGAHRGPDPLRQIAEQRMITRQRREVRSRRAHLRIRPLDVE